MSVARSLIVNDEKVALALAKRERGETLTRPERRLLAFEEAGMTPEKQAEVLMGVATKPGRNAMARVAAINAAGSLTGDLEKVDETKNINVKVSLEALWAGASSNPAGGEVSQLRPTTGQIVDSESMENGSESIHDSSARVLNMEQTKRDNAKSKRKSRRRRIKSSRL